MTSNRAVKGIVVRGLGRGASLMADPKILDRMQELVGFPVVPGTLNLHVAEGFERGLTAYLAAADIGSEWEAETGQAGYFFAPVLIADRYRGIAFQADEPEYPADLVELLCEVHLRQTLGLSDGDRIAFSMLASA